VGILAVGCVIRLQAPRKAHADELIAIAPLERHQIRTDVEIYRVQLLILQGFCLIFRQNRRNSAEYSAEAQLKRFMEHILTVA
jgi:hypothetical protein